MTFFQVHLRSWCVGFRRNIRSVLLAALLAPLAFPAHADLASVRHILAEKTRVNKWPPFHPATVRETLFPGLYRWQPETDTGAIYVNEAVTLLLYSNGNVINNWTQPVLNPQPISQAEKADLLNQMVRSVRLDNLIHIRQGSGGPKVLLLSAFDCPYCIKFERMLEASGDKINADIYIVPTTLNARDPKQLSTVRNIWCDSKSAAIWRSVLVKAATGHFSVAYAGCPFGNELTQDLEIILRSAGVKFGYPTMIFGNGIVGTAAQDFSAFSAQLKANDGSMWLESNPDRYAQFRSGSQTSPPHTATPRTVRDLLKRMTTK